MTARLRELSSDQERLICLLQCREISDFCVKTKLSISVSHPLVIPADPRTFNPILEAGKCCAVWDGLSLENKLNIPESKYLVNIFTKSQVAKRKSYVINQQTNIDQIKFLLDLHNLSLSWISLVFLINSSCVPIMELIKDKRFLGKFSSLTIQTSFHQTFSLVTQRFF